MNSVKVLIAYNDNNIFTLNDSNIKSIKFSNQLMDTSFNINPCVIEQYAEIVVKDVDGSIFGSLNSLQPEIKNYIKVTVYINSTVYNTYLASTWECALQSSTVTIHCNDQTKNLANYQTELMDVSNMTLYQLFNKAFSFTPYECRWNDASLLDEMSFMKVDSTYIPYQTVYDLLNKLCLVAFVRVRWSKGYFYIERCW